MTLVDQQRHPEKSPGYYCLNDTPLRQCNRDTILGGSDTNEQNSAAEIATSKFRKHFIGSPPKEPYHHQRQHRSARITTARRAILFPILNLCVLCLNKWKRFEYCLLFCFSGPCFLRVWRTKELVTVEIQCDWTSQKSLIKTVLTKRKEMLWRGG